MQPMDIGRGATVKGLVTEAAKLLSDLAANDLAALDLNVGEADVLTVLGVAKQDVMPSDLSDWLSITGAGTTGRLNALERRGLIERRKNPNDGRSVTIHLTREGRRLAAKVLDAMSQLSVPFFRFAMNLSKAHQEHFLNTRLPAEKMSMLTDEAARSLEQQRDIEKSDHITFDEYLRRYFAQTLDRRESMLG